MRRILLLIMLLLGLATIGLSQPPEPNATPAATPAVSPTPGASPVVAPTPQASPAVAATPAPAVTPTASPSATATPAPAATPKIDKPDAERVPVEFSTPQLSLENFLATMALAGPLRPDLYYQANRHLDLSQIPKVARDEQGVSLSQQLYSILQNANLNLAKLENYGDARSVVIYRQPSGDQLELILHEDGRWVFSARTVAVLPRMYRVLTSKGTIENWWFEALDFEVLGLNANLWMALLLLPLFAYGLGSLVLMFLRLPLRRILEKKAGLSNEYQKNLLKPWAWISASLFAWLGLSLLDLPSTLLVALTVVVKFTACLSLIVAAFRASDALSIYAANLTAATSTKFDDMLIPLVRRCVKTLVAIIGILFLAQNLDIQVWSLFAGFSIFGAMIALAGQDMVKNFFGSITVLTDQPFAVGDWIIVAGIEGVVEEVGFRSTRIRTFADSLITLPNSSLITASVENFGKRNYRRYSKKLPVRWNTPPEKLEAFCEGIREIIRRHPYTRKDSYQVWVNDFNDFSHQILIYVFWGAPDWNTELRERHRFLLDVHRLASDLGVELAYPSQRLLLERHEDSFQPDFEVEKQEAARVMGKEQTQKLLDASLPEETPGPYVIE
jgi:MscS family membrane protein